MEMVGTRYVFDFLIINLINLTCIKVSTTSVDSRIILFLFTKEGSYIFVPSKHFIEDCLTRILELNPSQFFYYIVLGYLGQTDLNSIRKFRTKNLVDFAEAQSSEHEGVVLLPIGRFKQTIRVVRSFLLDSCPRKIKMIELQYTCTTYSTTFNNGTHIRPSFTNSIKESLGVVLLEHLPDSPV